MKSIKFLLLTIFLTSNVHSETMESLQGKRFIKDGAPTEIFEGKDGVRAKAQRDAALRIGAQYGYMYKLDALKATINQSSDALDTIFDFNRLMKLTVQGQKQLYLLPPVILETRDGVQLSPDSRQLSKYDTTWEILKPERLVITAPNWRQYLVYDRSIDIAPAPNALLPKNSLESQKWKQWVTQGWESGIKQAEREMTRRANRLGVDFIGMVKYKRLINNDKMHEPIVASTQREVVKVDNKMHENERVITLSRGAVFNADAQDWKALIMDNRGSYRYPTEKAVFTHE
ncbi:type IV secretory system conjugative DNA transfer family protein [Vibrio breoganii]